MRLRRAHLLAAALAALCFFAAGIYLSRLIDREMREYLDASLGRLRQRTGVQIHINSFEAGLGKVRLGEISVGQTNWLVADQMIVRVSLVPGPDFLKPTQVVIGNLQMKLPIDRARWPDELNSLIRYFRDRQDTPQVKVERGSGMMPASLNIQAARLELKDDQNKGLTLDGISASVRIPERKFSAKVSKAMWGDEYSERHMEVEANMADASVIPVKVRRRQNFRGAPDWETSCKIVRATKTVSCYVDAISLPEPLTVFGQRYLSPAFSPGFRGSFALRQEVNVAGEASIKAEIAGDVTNVSGEHAAIGVGVVGPASFRIAGGGVYNKSTKRLTSAQTKVSLLTAGDVPEEAIVVGLNMDLTMTSIGKFKGDIVFDLPDISCKQALAALPRNFAPELGEFKLGGSAELHGSFHIEESGADLRIHDSRFNCLVLATPEMYSTAYLSGPFMIERGSGSGKISIPVDPARPYFATYANIPRHVRAAFVSSEDSGFFQHKGVEVAAIVGAAEKNAVVGRAAVGGSTITMQTVKNLFLARDKTISRKAQELFLAWHLEHVISKERILEIYLNMVEFGPGLYGVGRASQRFFNKTPAELSLKEAIYLASLLPAPIPRYRYFCKGAVTPNYDKILRQLLERMLGLGRISHDEFEAAMSERLNFSTLERDETCQVQGSQSAGQPSE